MLKPSYFSLGRSGSSDAISNRLHYPEWERDRVAGIRLFRAIEHGHLRCWEGDRYHDVSTSFDPLRAVDMLYALFRRSFGAIVSVGAMEAVAPFLSREPVPPPGVTLPEWAQRTSALVRRLREQRSWVTS